MSQLEKRALHLLEWHNTKFVCPECHNSGGEGKHRNDCEYFWLLEDLRKKAAGKP